MRRKEITALELTQACLARIKEQDQKVKAFLTVCEESALLDAREADIRREKGEDQPLLGIPYAAKDNILTKNVRTTAASRILEEYIAPFDATVVERLRRQGAVLLGKTNLDEFAHGASTENSAFGPTHNPWDLERVPGGSSGGSAAAVAADMCLFALGTDTGGSVRCPASFCGVAGFKPSYGRASRFGLIAMTSSTDVPGPLTKTAADAALVMEAISGPDGKDATAVVEELGKINISDPSLEGKKIGIAGEFFAQGMDAEVKDRIDEAIGRLKELGAQFVDISLPHTKYAVPVYYILTPSEISSNLARFDGIRYGFSSQEAKELADIYRQSRGQGFGPEAKRRIMLGTYALSSGYYDAYYKKAQKVRTIIKEELDAALSEVDFIVTATSPHPAFKLGAQSSDPLKMYLEDIYVSSASLAGLPALSLPVGLAEGLPVGMQIISSRQKDTAVLEAGAAFQRLTEYHKAKAVL